MAGDARGDQRFTERRGADDRADDVLDGLVLEQEAVGAGRERADHGVGLVRAGHGDDRRAGGGAHHVAEGVARGIGVHEHDVDRDPAERVDRVARSPDVADDVDTAALEGVAHRMPEGRLVVDQQNADPGDGCRGGGHGYLVPRIG